MRRHRPAVVVGMGACSRPGGASRPADAPIPLLIHEHKRDHAGYTKPVPGPAGSRSVCRLFPTHIGDWVVTRVIGNRCAARSASLPPPAQRFAQRAAPIRILVFWREPGRRARLNAVLPLALARLAWPHRHRRAPSSGSAGSTAPRRAYRVRWGVRRASRLHRGHGGKLRLGRSSVNLARAGVRCWLAGAGVGAILCTCRSRSMNHQTHNHASWSVKARRSLISDPT